MDEDGKVVHAGTEEAMRIRETYVRTLCEYVSDLVAILDTTGTYRYVSPSHRRVLGYAPHELEGQNAFALVHPHDLPRTKSAFERGLPATDVAEGMTMRVRHADGSWHSLEVVGMDRLADPAMEGVVVTMRDVTRQERAAEERSHLLARAEEARADAVARAAQIEATFEAIVDAVIAFDREGRILRMNRVARALYGDDRPGGRAALLPERILLLEPRDDQGRPLPRERWPMYRILRGEVLTGAGAVEAAVRGPNGSTVQLSVSGAPVYDEAGTVVGGTLVARNVTERRRLERRTHEVLSALLEMAETLVHIDEPAVTGAEGGEDAGPPAASGVGKVAQRLVLLTRSILGCRRVGMTMYDEETGASQPVAVVGLTPEQEQGWRSGQPGAALREYVDAAQMERLRRDEVLVLDATNVPVQNLPFGARTCLLALLRVSGRVVGVLSLDHGAIAHDYTSDEVALARAVARLTAFVIERERLLRDYAEARANELALREANRRMDTFLSLASHELRTPLTAITGNIQLAERRLLQAAEKGTGAAEITPLLDRARHSVRRLQRLVDDLLDISRIQADRLQIHCAAHDLVALVRDAVDEQRVLDPTRLLRLDLPGEARVPVSIDAERLRQVVLNYLTNALKYAPRERPIEVGVRVEGSVARAWVRDEGPGLPEAEQERIWERFYQVEGIEQAHGSQVGLGLGLYISRIIVEQHGGQVGVASAPGAGATFWLTVPLIDAP